MPSVLTHPAAAFGLFPWLREREHAGKILLAGAACTVLPDVDVLGRALGIPYRSAFGHRGLTHSIAFAVLMAAAALATLRRMGIPARGSIFLYLFLCGLSHGLLDGMTDGGLGVAYFAPFSNARFFLPWRPIAVSPLSIPAFFSYRARPILQSELLLVWVPAALLGLTGFLVHRWGSRPKDRAQSSDRKFSRDSSGQ